VCALLGRNGAGKTTTVRILTTLLRANAGHARVAGFDVTEQAPQVRTRIGVTGQTATMDELLTGAENLETIGRFCHLGAANSRRRAAALLEQFDLTAAARQLVKNYSGGMRRRLDLAASLIHDPRSSSSTNPPPDWTRSAAPRCGRRSAPWSPGDDGPADHPVPR